MRYQDIDLSDYLDDTGRDPDFGYGFMSEVGCPSTNLLLKTQQYCEQLLKTESGKDFKVYIRYEKELINLENRLHFVAVEQKYKTEYYSISICDRNMSFDEALQAYGRHTLCMLIDEIMGRIDHTPIEPAKKIEAEKIELVSYTCATCGSPLKDLDGDKLVCPHCGREYYKRITA